MFEPAPFLAESADLPKLRASIAHLAGMGFTESRVTERLALRDLAELQWRHVPLYRSEGLSARDPLALAIDLFLLQGTLPADELARLFPASERDLLVASGLLAIDEAGRARARASLFPLGRQLIFSDHAWPELPHPGYPTVPADHVMAIGRDSRNLARCTPRRPFLNALDLCTGSGIHGLLASSHAGRVLAVDINPRAGRCVRFNAQVSGAANLEVAVGDLYEVVRGERFDLITANPPFVPSPRDAVQFRDGGRSGEDIQKRIVAGLPHHLAPGGIAQMVTELGESDKDDTHGNERECKDDTGYSEPAHRLRAWLSGAPMDIHILRIGEHTAMEYAVGHAKGDTFASFMQSVEEWAGNLRAQGYSRIVSLIISFQWSDSACGPPWERSEESPPPTRAAGAEIDAAFLAERSTRRLGWEQALKRSWLRRAGPTALLDAQVLGADIPAKARATLLGRSLRIEHRLNPLERRILDRIAGVKKIAVRDLIRCSDLSNVDESAALQATRSLLRRQLISC